MHSQTMALSKRWILLNAVLSVMLAGSTFLNVSLYRQAQKYYFELNQTRLDPAGLGYYPVNLQAPKGPQQSRVVFFGDSRAAGWTSLRLSGYDFMNRGISSQTSVQAVQRFASHVNSLQPTIVVIQVGINDLKTVALFPEDRDVIVANCQANIQQLVTESRKLGAIVIVTTIFPVGDVPLERKPFWSDEIGETVQQTNAYIMTLADDQTFVLDAFSILADRQGELLQAYRTDELHLNEHGYRALNQELTRLLNRISQETAEHQQTDSG